MARGVQLLQLTTRLRAELGRSTSAALGAADVPTLHQAINRAYETLYERPVWPHLRREFAKISLAAGQRYYDPPAEMDTDGVERAVVWWSGHPYPLTRGISFEQYSAYDSTIDERTSPASRWDVRWTGVTDQIEVWPIPSDNNQRLQFIGRTKFTRLVNDDDLCRLDDVLVVLHAAVTLAMGRKGNDAAMFQAAAQQRYEDLLANGHAADPVTRIGLGPGFEPELPSQVVVRVR
jgi:hypothetical protein